MTDSRGSLLSTRLAQTADKRTPEEEAIRTADLRETQAELRDWARRSNRWHRILANNRRAAVVALIALLLIGAVAGGYALGWQRGYAASSARLDVMTRYTREDQVALANHSASDPVTGRTTRRWIDYERARQTDFEERAIGDHILAVPAAQEIVLGPFVVKTGHEYVLDMDLMPVTYRQDWWELAKAYTFAVEVRASKGVISDVQIPHTGEVRFVAPVDDEHVYIVLSDIRQPSPDCIMGYHRIALKRVVGE